MLKLVFVPIMVIQAALITCSGATPAPKTPVPTPAPIPPIPKES